MNIRAYILCGALSVTSWLPAAEQTLTEQFQQALFEEEANRDLDAAIAGYEAVIQRLDEQRDLAATAVFRMGESYRKLGKTNEAARAYERILSEFGDQETLVRISSQNLSILRPHRAGTEEDPGSESQISQFERAYLGGQTALRSENLATFNLEQERLALSAFLNTVDSLDSGSREQLIAIQTYHSNERLAQLLAQMDATELKLTELQERFGPEHPNIKSAVDQFEHLAIESDEERKAIIQAATTRYEMLGQLLDREEARRVKGSELSKADLERRKLYQEELVLMEEQVSQAQHQFESGVLSRDDLIRLQREQLQLKRELTALETGTTP